MPVLYSYTAMIPSILPSTGPIGVFDSGYGGLTILDKIRGLMPEYDYIYLGDSARCPYGPRSFEVVYEFTLQAVSKLFELGCPLVILACNTASAKALRTYVPASGDFSYTFCCRPDDTEYSAGSVYYRKIDLLDGA